jgi:hypothetical protein
MGYAEKKRLKKETTPVNGNNTLNTLQGVNKGERKDLNPITSNP